MKTVLETLQSGASYFEKRGIESARLQMEHLLAHVLDCERLQLYLEFDRPLEEAQLEPLRDLVKRRGQREPLQHLLGTVEFHGYEFLCDHRALVARPETEELVDLVLKRQGESRPERVLDMGAGSGVIGLTLAAEWPGAKITLADMSTEALALAKENAGRMGLDGDDGRTQFVESNLFGGVEGCFDLIVANLPYLSEEDMKEISPEVAHDPESALFGGESGRELLLLFISGCPAHLTDGGGVAMEVGAGQAQGLVDEMESAGLGGIEIAKDYAGIDRFLFATRT